MEVKHIEVIFCPRDEVLRYSTTQTVENILFKTNMVCTYPQTAFFNKKIIYLTNVYEYSLREFIESPYRNDKRLILYMEQRINFIKPELEISRYHDFLGYHCETYPFIYRVYFSDNMNAALVLFSTSYWENGYAVYRKRGNYWIREDYKRVSGVQ